MAVLSVILIVLGVLVVLVLIIGFTSPRIARMNRTVTINASKENIFGQMNNLKNFVDNWSPWTEKDLSAKHEYNSTSEGVGAAYTWKGEPKKVGEGSMEIIECEENSRVKTLLKFKGRGDAYATWYLSGSDGNVEVKWDFEADNGNNPIGRIFGRMMDKFLGPDYENGLNKLKQVCESSN